VARLGDKWKWKCCRKVCSWRAPKSSAAEGTKSMINNGQQSSRRPKGRLGDSLANKSRSNEKGHKLSAIPASMNGSMASSSLASSKNKAAVSRQRQNPPDQPMNLHYLFMLIFKTLPDQEETNQR
jgi:hypothetical protein